MRHSAFWDAPVPIPAVIFRICEILGKLNFWSPRMSLGSSELDDRKNELRFEGFISILDHPENLSKKYSLSAILEPLAWGHSNRQSHYQLIRKLGPDLIQNSELSHISGISCKNSPLVSQPFEICLRGSAGGENLGILVVKTSIFLREIVFLKCKMAKFSACGGLQNVKTPKTSFWSPPQARKNWISGIGK